MVGRDARAPKILLVHEDPKRLKWWSRIVHAVHAESFISSSLRDLTSDVDLAVVNYDTAAARPEQLLECLSDPNTRNRILTISEGRCSPEQYGQLFAGGLANLLATTGELGAIDFIVTLQKILRGDIFGIEKYFSWGVEPVSVDVRRSEDKQMVMDRASEFAQTLRLHPSLIERYLTVVDELFSNALYNAPIDAEGKRRFAGLARSNPVELEREQAVQMAFCCDGLRLGVGSTDPFGSLRPMDALEYLARCFEGGAAQISRRGGGAGLGFYMMFDAMTHLVINVQPGVRTEVLGVIDIHGSLRDVATQGKSFNIFTTARP